MKALITLTLLVSFIWAQYNPNLYSQFGNKLFEASVKFESLKYNDILINKIQAYKSESELIRSQGLKLDSKKEISSTEKKEYLKSLRKLENSYQSIVSSLSQVLLNSIQNNNYNKFAKLCNSNLNDIFQSDTIYNKATTFYQKNKANGSINSLDQLIHQKKLERKAILEQTQEKQLTEKQTVTKKKYTIEIQPYKDAYGNDYEMKLNTSFDECKAYCLKDSKCKAFLFNTKREKCWFKNKVGRTTDIRHGILGIKKLDSR